MSRMNKLISSFRKDPYFLHSQNYKKTEDRLGSGTFANVNSGVLIKGNVPVALKELKEAKDDETIDSYSHVLKTCSHSKFGIAKKK